MTETPTNIGERILDLRERWLEITQDEFARQLGIDRSYVSAIETGRRQPSKALILEISYAFLINPAYLESGELPVTLIDHKLWAELAGAKDHFALSLLRWSERCHAAVRALGRFSRDVSPLFDESRPTDDPEIVHTLWGMLSSASGKTPVYREDLAPPEIVIVSQEEARGRMQRLDIAEKYIPVPVVADRAAARDPLLVNEDDIEEYALVPKRFLRPGGRYGCVRIRGKSMWPALDDGDIVAVNHERSDPEDLRRKMAALLIPDEGVTIKYIEALRDHLHVWGENRAEFEPRSYDLDQVKVVGAVEWAWRRFE